MNSVAFHSGTGRRKTSIARVRLISGEGEVVVNGKSLDEHFGNAVDLNDVLLPFRVTDRRSAPRGRRAPLRRQLSPW